MKFLLTSFMEVMDIRRQIERRDKGKRFLLFINVCIAHTIYTCTMRSGTNRLREINELYK